MALGLFLLYVAVAGPIVMLRLGDFQWFMRDEWVFLAQDTDLPGDLLRPLNAHWVTLPRAVYALGWRVTGVTRYWPYQGVTVVLHLTAVVLLWVVMRRAQASAWLATAAASLLVLFGPGSQNITWAFQMALTGSLVFGLAHLILADHDGGWDRRDSLGLACGVLGLTCSGIAITMVCVVVLSVLIRRGPVWAIAHGAPPAILYLIWVVTQHPATGSPTGRPTVGQYLGWVGRGVEGTLAAISAYRPLEVVFGLVIVVGMILAWSPWRREDLADARARLAAPTAALAGTVAFFAITTWGRWRAGPSDIVVSSRYLHISAALALPALAVGADALARRWRPLLPILFVVLLLPIPANLDGFEPRYFGEHYNEQRQRILTTAPRLDFAREVPRDIQPLPDVYTGKGLTIGFLLDAMDAGKLEPSTFRITPPVENEFRIRLGVRQRRGTPTYPGDCAARPVPYDVHLEEGDVMRFAGQPAISVVMIGADGEPISNSVTWERGNGTDVEIVAEQLDLRISPADRREPLVLCGIGA